MSKKRVLVACSGGPDSMALLDMSKDRYEVYAAHVNYHKRKTANRDEEIVRDYCLLNGIPFLMTDYKDEKKNGNFQDKARVFRYEFFARMIKENDLEGVLVAHHKDDLIETYLMQVKRAADVSYYGLKRTTIIKGVKVIRPLLKYTKDDLLKYCDENGIPYGIDESNLSDLYTRNRIRHEIVEKMSPKEKDEVIKEIREKNKKLKEDNDRVRKFLDKRTRIPVKDFLGYGDKIRLLRTFLGINVSSREADELIRQIEESKSFEALLKDRYLVKEYGYLEVYPKEDDYSLTLDKVRCLKGKHFRLAKKGGSKEGVYLKDEDFPIMVRNYHEGDSIAMRYGTKKINRFFIDNKISSRERKMWPVLTDVKGNVILVPGIGCDKHHYSANLSLYMLKL